METASFATDVVQIIEDGRMISYTYVDGNLTWHPLAESHVAFSHVWADGLGNTHENAMYSCQLAFLQDAADRAISHEATIPTPFRIDTLCVPVNNIDARRLAISCMGTVYGDAKVVLVLDGGLQTQPLPQSPEQGWLSIAQSTWNSRLWTYQESCRTTTLTFMFQDGPYLARTSKWVANEDDGADESCVRKTRTPEWIDEVTEGYFHLGSKSLSLQTDPERFDSVRNHCAEKLLACVGLSNRLWNGHAYEASSPGREAAEVLGDKSENVLARLSRFRTSNTLFHSVQRTFMEHLGPGGRPPNKSQRSRWFWLFVAALGWRSSSRHEDETICLATLLYIDPLRLLNMPVQERMRALLIEVEQLPKRFILFTGARDERDGYRWVPRSFLLPLHPRSSLEETDRIVANHFMDPFYVSEEFKDGHEMAHATEHGLFFQCKGFTLNQNSVQSKQYVSDRLFFREGSCTRLVCFVQGSQFQQTTVDWKRLQAQELGIIVGGNVITGHVAGAVLCRLTREPDHEVLIARFECLCLLSCVCDDMNFDFNDIAGWKISWTAEDKHADIEAVAIPQSQWWVLG